jgi:hypothetical protein
MMRMIIGAILGIATLYLILYLVGWFVTFDPMWIRELFATPVNRFGFVLVSVFVVLFGAPAGATIAE